jgi:hypothetical protein
MSNTIQIKRTTVAGKIPIILQSGEIATNIADAKLFIKDLNNNIRIFSDDQTQISNLISMSMIFGGY